MKMLPGLLLTVLAQLSAQVLYVGNSGDNTISAYVIDQESGLLTEVQRANDSGSPLGLAMHPNGKLLYVSNGGGGIGSPNLAAFSIDTTTGLLTQVGSTTMNNGVNPQAVAIDPSGKYAYVAQQGAAQIAAYSIDASTGATTAVPGSPFATPPNPSCVVVHPNGKFVYASASGAGQIAAFAIGSSGALTAISGSPFAARNNMIWMAMDPAGKFLYVAERQDSAVLVYSVNADTGALTQVGNPVPTGPGISGVVVDPAGKFVYASNFGNSSVTTLTIGANGGLSNARTVGSILGAYFPILDPSGKFLYIPGQTAGAVGAFSVDAAGTVKPLPQQFFSAGATPSRGVAALFNPPILPPMVVDSVANYHNRSPRGIPNSGIAQGARLAVDGKNLGPFPGVGAGSDTLGTTLGGVTVQIQSGDVTTQGLLVAASSSLVTAVVPSTTPLGEATVTVTYKGRTTTPYPVTIVSASPSIRTLNEIGTGPARAYNVPADATGLTDALLQVRNSLVQSAKPGQRMVVQAMGLGAVQADETQPSTSVQLDTPVDVIVGNQQATVLAKLRVDQGTDFVLFQLPDSVPEGCYVPLAIRAGGVVSNVAAVSIAASGGTCNNPTGLEASDIDAASKSGKLRAAAISLSHADLGPFGVSDSIGGFFATYDFDAVKQALSPGLDGPGIRPGIPLPPPGTCLTATGTPRPGHPFDAGGDPTPSQPLNGGSAITVNGPKGSVKLTSPDYNYQPDDPVIVAGDYSADNGAGTQAVGPFKAAITMPPPVQWTNQSAITSIDRSQDLTVTWSGGTPSKEYALIVGVATTGKAAGAFACTEKVSAGTFTVPAWILSTLPKSELVDIGQLIPGGFLIVGTGSFTSAGRFTANGIDAGVISYEQVTYSIVPYQ